MIAEPLKRDDSFTRWDLYEPVYRVDFWHQHEPSPGVPAEKMMYQRDSYSVSRAHDVDEVVAWADENAQGRLYVIWVQYRCQGERGIIRVRGEDPTNPVGNASLGERET